MLIIKQFFYLLALYGVFHLFILVDRAFASLVGEKMISALTYGLMIATVPHSIIKLEHMIITALSEAKISMRMINFYIKYSILISLPFTVFFLFCKVYNLNFLDMGTLPC